MVLGHSVKSYRHMMKNIVSSLIIHDRIQTTYAKAKRLAKAANKLINFAKKGARGRTSPLNLLRGRVASEKVHKKLMMNTVPKLQNVRQNYVNISKNIRRRRGDNAPMVYVTIRNSEKEQAVKMQVKQLKQKSKQVDSKNYSRMILSQEKEYYQKLLKQKPEMKVFFERRLAKVEFEQWMLDKPLYERRLPPLI